MKHVAFLIPDLGVGGSEISVTRLANLLSINGYKVDIIVYNSKSMTSSHQIKSGISIHYNYPCSFYNPILIYFIYFKLRALKPDIVIGWSTYANFLSTIVSIFPNNWTIVVSERNYPPKLFSNLTTNSFKIKIIFFLIKKLYKRADVITANSKNCIDYLKQYIGDGPEYFHLRNFIDVESAVIKSKLKENKIPKKCFYPRILSLGRIDGQKGFDILLEAFKKVREHKTWSLLIVGDGPERKVLKHTINKLGLKNSVTWAGKVNNPYPFYDWADIVVIPSRYEGSPNVLLEAMTCGCAVICTDCKTGPKEMTENGRYAKLIPTDNPDELAEAVLDLGSNCIKSQNLGKKASKHIKNKYDVEKVSKDILTFINRI
jgi:glycosyltransferase involved in cell wall biosynthesis